MKWPEISLPDIVTSWISAFVDLHQQFAEGDLASRRAGLLVLKQPEEQGADCDEDDPRQIFLPIRLHFHLHDESRGKPGAVANIYASSARGEETPRPARDEIRSNLGQDGAIAKRASQFAKRRHGCAVSPPAKQMLRLSFLRPTEPLPVALSGGVRRLSGFGASQKSEHDSRSRRERRHARRPRRGGASK